MPKHLRGHTEKPLSRRAIRRLAARRKGTRTLSKEAIAELDSEQRAHSITASLAIYQRGTDGEHLVGYGGVTNPDQLYPRLAGDALGTIPVTRLTQHCNGTFAAREVDPTNVIVFSDMPREVVLPVDDCGMTLVCNNPDYPKFVNSSVGIVATERGNTAAICATDALSTPFNKAMIQQQKDSTTAVIGLAFGLPFSLAGLVGAGLCLWSLKSRRATAPSTAATAALLGRAERPQDASVFAPTSPKTPVQPTLDHTSDPALTD